LRGFKGVLQGDGYGGFETMAGARKDRTEPTLPDERRLGCGMHIRRKFEAAFEAGDLRGAIALGFFRMIYAIEERLRLATCDERPAARQTESLVLVDELHAWIASLEPRRVIPDTLLAKATTYAINQKPRWRRCFESGLCFIDNGEPERQIWYPAQGRRAYLFAGRDDGARRLATAYTLVAACRTEGINTWECLTVVLEKLAANWPHDGVDELLPSASRGSASHRPDSFASMHRKPYQASGAAARHAAGRYSAQPGVATSGPGPGHQIRRRVR